MFHVEHCQKMMDFERSENMTILPFEKFSALLETVGISSDRMAYVLFEEYAAMLVEYNKVMNLTGITDPEGISEKHFLDSLLVFKCCDIRENSAVIDVGTGAGFPGLPMKIYRPDLRVTLLDSLMKRVNFLKDVSEKISEHDNKYAVDCIHGRAEDFGKLPDHREKYDIAAARAVAALPVLAEYCLPFVKTGGSFIAMKGPGEDLKAGENAVKILGGEIACVHDLSLPCGDKRVIAVIKKISATPTKYPRSSGQISKKSIL